MSENRENRRRSGEKFPGSAGANSRLADLGKFGRNFLIFRKTERPIRRLGRGIRRYPVFVW
jgi:hypothetical protein